MRKAFLIAAATVALSAPAMAQPYYDRYNPAAPAELATGAAAGTVAGVAVSEGWIGGSLGAALPTTVAGAAATGGVVGVGTVAGLDAIVQPCRGFAAVLGMNREYCAQRQAALDAESMGVGPRRVTHRRYIR